MSVVVILFMYPDFVEGWIQIGKMVLLHEDFGLGNQERMELSYLTFGTPTKKNNFVLIFSLIFTIHSAVYLYTIFSPTESPG